MASFSSDYNSLHDLREIICYPFYDLLKYLNDSNISPKHTQMVGDRLKSLRISKGMSLADMAQLIQDGDPQCHLATKFSKHTLHRLENGRRKLSLIEAVVIANILKVSVFELLPPELRYLGNSVDRGGVSSWEVSDQADKVSRLINSDTGQEIFVFNETDSPLPRLLYILAGLTPYRIIELPFGGG